MAQTEATIALLGPAVLEWTANQQVAQRRGNQHLSSSPHGVYPCMGVDRWIAIAVTSDDAWNALVDVLGQPQWALDRDLLNATTRLERAAQIDRLLAEVTAKRDADELMQALQARGVAAGVVRDVADVVQRDPQLHHRHHWLTLNHAEMGPSLYNAPAFRLSGASAGPRSPAPLLGEHNQVVLREILGMTVDEVSALEAAGVLK
jgi:benzylsuccinate CoA-transferase BbsF subunit